MEIGRRNLITILVLIAVSRAAIGDALTHQYYWQSCPRVQEIVRAAVQKKIQQTVVTIPATLRLFFHDAFITVWLLFSLFLISTFSFFFFLHLNPQFTFEGRKKKVAKKQKYLAMDSF
jgi:glycerol uptake facilitator-like aquaporin